MASYSNFDKSDGAVAPPTGVVAGTPVAGTVVAGPVVAGPPAMAYAVPMVARPIAGPAYPDAGVPQPISNRVFSGEAYAPAPIVRGEWTSKWYDCFNHLDSCVMAFCLTFWAWPKAFAAGGVGTFKSMFITSLILVFFWFVGQAFFPIMIIVAIVYIALATRYRSKLRAKFEIPGNMCSDCMLHTFCNPCAVAQEMKHTLYPELDSSGKVRAIAAPAAPAPAVAYPGYAV